MNRRFVTMGTALALASGIIAASPGTASAHGRPGGPPSGSSTVYVTHGLPLDDKGTLVDVFAGPAGSGPAGAAQLADDFAFGRTAGPLSLAAASYSVYLAVPSAGDDGRLDAGEVIYGQDLAVPAGKNLSVVASFNAAGSPNLAVFVNDLSPSRWWVGRLSVRHAAAAPAVDVDLGIVPWAREHPALVRTVGPAANGAQADVDLLSWKYDVKVRVAGTSTVVAGAEGLTVAGRSLTNVYAVGVPGSSFGFVTQTIPFGR
jgi:hypothetical protein